MKANEADFHAKKLNKAMYFMVPSFVFWICCHVQRLCSLISREQFKKGLNGNYTK
jgi:hypothetical protein